ncbi:hypothetical protein [Paracoccus sp. IB05]|uniref:hypothetical protein n=1 Tax=Paracoccus sp. IB05 TaxID=2779367 RepID=UPI0018E7D234|nr:hypothetical protein [Paracoccus sp. IB05]MBJ2153876.1 hypothetical protein [Paracoccus sp. IB05]
MVECDNDLEGLNRQHALRAHQVHYSYLDKGNEAAISSGQAAVKNLFLMHGGALIAMLTFTSGILTNNASTVRADSLVDPMMRFAFGLALAAAASAGTYLTNYCYLAGAHNQTLVWNHPYLEKGRASKVWEGFGVALHVATVSLAFASLILFVCGFLGVKEALVAAYDAAQIEDTSGASTESAERPVSVPVVAGGDVGTEASAIAPSITEEP